MRGGESPLLDFTPHTHKALATSRRFGEHRALGDLQALTCGVVHFRVEWKVNNGNLEAWGWGKFLYMSIGGAKD